MEHHNKARIRSLRYLCVVAVADALGALVRDQDSGDASAAAGGLAPDLAILPSELINHITNALIKRKKLTPAAFGSLLTGFSHGALNLQPLASQITLEHFEVLAKMDLRHFTSFEMVDCAISPHPVEAVLRRMPSLRLLDLSRLDDSTSPNRKFTPFWRIEDPIGTLGAMRQLRDLRLSFTLLDSEAATAISGLKDLVSLMISHTSGLSDQGAILDYRDIALITSKCTKIEKWGLRSVEMQTGDWFDLLLACSEAKLKSVTFNNFKKQMPVDGSSADRIRELCSEIRYFSVEESDSPALAFVAATSGSNLTSLRLKFTSLTNMDLESILSSCKSLEVLELDSVVGVDEISICDHQYLVHLELSYPKNHIQFPRNTSPKTLKKSLPKFLDFSIEFRSRMALKRLEFNLPSLKYASWTYMNALEAFSVTRCEMPELVYFCGANSSNPFIVGVFNAIESFPSLKILDIRYLVTSDLETATIISKCKGGITHINAYYNDNIKNLTLNAIVKFCGATLETLSLAGDMGSEFEQPEFDFLIENCPRLRDVDVNWNYNVTPTIERSGLLVRWIGSDEGPGVEWPWPVDTFCPHIGDWLSVPPHMAKYPFFSQV